MRFVLRNVAAIVFGLLLLPIGAATVSALPPMGFKAINPAELKPVVIETQTSASAFIIVATPAPEPIYDNVGRTTSPVRPQVEQPAPKPKVVSTPKPESIGSASATGNSIRGKASWYCKAGRSVCHYKYPDRAGVADMYAAACGKLRRAMGSGWRHDVVRVTRIDTGKTIKVKLVDWCGSEDKVIDLYYDAMRLLGGTGVLKVKVSW